VYEKLGDISKKSEYLEKYIKIKDSIDDAEREALVIPVKKIIDREKRNERKDRIQLYILITIIIMLALAVIFGLRQRYIRKQKEKEAIITETLQETDKLKSKLNNSLDELTKLASTNDPFFLMKFKEVYPEFYETLITRYPHLSPNDIRFSCFLRLNLSTKTIATYKNISIRTIESRKYRLRKKLGLPSDVDLNKWMMEL
jgi:DNA-binding CsgD family transcriptional regulator